MSKNLAPAIEMFARIAKSAARCMTEECPVEVHFTNEEMEALSDLKGGFSQIETALGALFASKGEDPFEALHQAGLSISIARRREVGLYVLLEKTM